MRAVLLLALLLLAPAAAAQAPKTVVRVKLDPATGVVVGQPVNLMVDVLFTGEMTHPPRVTVPEVEGAQVMRFETQGITIRDTIDGADAIGQEFTFVVMPRRGGSLTIPPAAIELLDKAGDVIGTAKGEAQTLSVTVPKGVDASSPVIASASVKAKESWSPDPKAPLTTGGALVRTIERQAADVPALGMADFAFTAPEGVRVYADPPVSDDRTERGAVTGHRTDRVTYVFEKAGRFDLPALAQPWWDLKGAAAKSETLAGITVSVVAAPAAKAHPAASGLGARSSAAWLRIALEAVGTVAAVALLFALGLWLKPRWQERRDARQASEVFARHDLRKAARSGDASAAYQALLNWLGRLDAPSRDAARSDTALGPSITLLERALFGNGAWSRQDGHRLAAALEGIAARGSGRGAHQAAALPPLNPATHPRLGV
jgi:hypothetical protein